MSRHVNDGRNCTEPCNLDFTDGMLIFPEVHLRSSSFLLRQIKYDNSGYLDLGSSHTLAMLLARYNPQMDLI
jgi:hypothetical protein